MASRIVDRIAEVFADGLTSFFILCDHDYQAGEPRFMPARRYEARCGVAEASLF